MSTPKASPATLREALLEHCRLAGWTPQHVGRPANEPGLHEALLEIIACREAEASQLSLELIERCEHLGWKSPWLQDNRARSLLHQGFEQEAVTIWKQLAADEEAGAVARNTLEDIEAIKLRDTDGVMANRIRQLRERNRPELWQPLLLQSLLNGAAIDAGPLAEVIRETAMDFRPPAGAPWDGELLRQELLLQLYERQLTYWEQSMP